MEKSTKKKLIIGLGLGAAILLFLGIRKKSVSVPVEELQAKRWTVNGVTNSGASLNINYLPDGRVIIGNGYVGQLVNPNTILTNVRNGAPDAEKIWTAA